MNSYEQGFKVLKLIKLIKTNMLQNFNLRIILSNSRN